jgi:putative tricarboxylic transport membrane protein
VVFPLRARASPAPPRGRIKKLDGPLAPLILTLILGPLMEQSLRQSLEISRGDFSILLTRPISLTLIVIAAIFTIGTTMRIAARVRGADAEI